MNNDVRTLLLAAQIGSVPHMNSLLEQGQNPNYVGNFNFSYNNGQRTFMGEASQGLAAAYFAIASGQEEILDLLLEYGLDLDASRFIHTNPLEAAILGGRIQMLHKCLDNGALIDVQNHYGKTALHIAVDENLSEAVDILLYRGANPNLQETELNWGALHKAAFHGNAAIVASLLEADANVNLLTSDGDAPLHMAAWKGHNQVIRLLLNAGANPDILRKDNQSALFVATAYQNVEVAVTLIKYGCLINCKDSNGRTPLHTVACNNDTKLANLLIKHEANVLSQNNSRDTPLHLSALRGNLRMFDFLVKRGANIWQKGWNGCTALHDAASEGHIDIVHSILRTKPTHQELNLKDNGEMTALGGAITADRLEIVELLIKAGCSPRVRYRSSIKNCLLHWAAFNNSKRCLTFVLEKKLISVDTKNSQGTTALHVAAMKGRIDIMKILVKHGADPSATTIDGDNSLHLALMENRVEIVNFLLERRLLLPNNVNQENSSGSSPLSIAADKSDLESINLLIQAGGRPYRRNKKSHSPLQFAAKNGDVSIARALLKPLCESKRIEFINKTSHDGWTALHIASDMAHYDFVKFLLERGADTDIYGPTGYNPFHLAIRKDSCRLFCLYCHKGADLSQTTNKGETLMHVAASAGAKNILQMLVTRLPKQIFAKQTSDGTTPLMTALAKQKEATAEQLIILGSDLNAETTVWRDTPLDLAAKSGLADAARLILKKGINIKHVGLLNRTALHWAAISGNAKLVIELLCRGCDPYIKDVFGFTAKDFAIQQKNDEAISILTWWPSRFRPQQEISKSITTEDDFPERHICPISKCLMRNPVFAADGFAYEQCQIRSWLDRSITSPVTGQRLSNGDLIPAQHLKQELEASGIDNLLVQYELA